MKYLLALSVCACVIGIAGCGESNAAVDASMAIDAAALDASLPADAGSIDAGTADAGTDDAGTDDAGNDDAGAVDAGMAPMDSGTAGCDYVGVDEVIVECGGRYVFVSRFESTVRGCEPFFGFDPEGPRFSSYAEAIASNATCDATCQWHFASAVTRLYCGRRSGYEVLEARGCPDLYRFPEGYYPSVEAHDAAHPCM